jgi:hypothetical protein
MSNRVLLVAMGMVHVDRCGGKPVDIQPAEDLAERNEKGNLILYVSNQSFAISPVDIIIHIEGKKIVDRDFDVGNQHNWISQPFKLVKGENKLVAVTKKWVRDSGGSSR